jgi:hypothetical protein
LNYGKKIDSGNQSEKIAEGPARPVYDHKDRCKEGAALCYRALHQDRTLSRAKKFAFAKWVIASTIVTLSHQKREIKSWNRKKEKYGQGLMSQRKVL